MYVWIEIREISKFLKLLLDCLHLAPKKDMHWIGIPLRQVNYRPIFFLFERQIMGYTDANEGITHFHIM